MSQNTSLNQIKNAEAEAVKKIEAAKIKNLSKISQTKQEMEDKIKQAPELIADDKNKIVTKAKSKIEAIKAETKVSLTSKLLTIQGVSEEKKNKAVDLIINQALAK